ncbi:MAG: hypothetical protein M1834_009047 [Cirrosporium novae-zelandiae]|nr:MAG: hypothetical protein M1834_009047 [Cirrosporium novae-zelandiae]
MGYSTICYLCGRYIDSTCAGKDSQAWQAYFQILRQLDENYNRLIEPSDTSIPSGTNVVHAACWVVVAKVLGSATINANWLERFYHCLQDLKPFLKSISSLYSPEILEPNLECKSDNDEQASQIAEHGTTIFGHIPIEIIQIVYSFLDCYTDIYNIQQLINVEPEYKIWCILGQKYQDYDTRFGEGTQQDLINRFRRILENLRQRPSLFPHALNYGTVWDNVKVVLNKLEDTLTGEDFDSNVFHCDAISSRFRTKSLNKKIFHFDRTLGLTIRFTHVGNHRYLCGFGYGDEIIGYKGDSSVQVPSVFHGLQLVSDGEGFIAIQILSQTITPIYWPKEFSETGFYNFIFGQLEWPRDQNMWALEKNRRYDRLLPSNKCMAIKLSTAELSACRYCKLPFQFFYMALYVFHQEFKYEHCNQRILTSLGRTIIFGDEALTTWVPGSSCKNGIFCTSEISDEYCLSVLGTFFNESDEPEQSVELPQPDMSIVWETQTVKFDGDIMPTLAFLSTASLSSISKITIYTDGCSEKYLSGMKIFHTDRSPEIVGEAREEYQTVLLDEPLQHILTYYTINYATCYRIQGLVFTCPSTAFKVGLCEGPRQEFLEITTVRHF